VKRAKARGQGAIQRKRKYKKEDKLS